MSQTSISSETLTAFRSELAERYRLERELGQGGMATVYLAHDVANDRLVALKVLNPELAATLGAERFLREIEVGRTLLHPHIVGVLDSGEADGKLFYTMPFVEGASLRDKLDREKQLSIEEAIDLTKQIAEALGFAHSKNVIHRDIKPENILLSKGQALVADFGIARAVSVAGGERLTRTGMAVGTPTYMSPEQAMGSKDVTPESDIYSLACMVYEMLAGQPPFTGPTAMALLARHSLDNVPSLKIVRGTVPDAVEDAIVRAMAKVPADRFHSATDFANALTDDEGAAVRRLNSIKAKAIAASTVADVQVAGGRRKIGLIAALVAVPLVLGAGWFAWSRTKGGAGADPKLAAMKANDIAVLYFDDRSPDHSLRYLSDGLTEALIHELGTVTALHVTSRNGVMRFKGKDVAPDSIAKALNVGTIVSGTVAASGDKIRVTVDMLDARTGESIGSTEIEKMKADAFALQDTLVTEVSSALRKQLGQQVQVLTSKAGTSNAAAWEGFQRANQTVSEGDSLLAAGNAPAAIAVYARADTALDKVGAMDGKWAAAPALQGLLDYRIALRSLGAGAGMPAVSAWIESGLPKANRAVSLAPNDADALEARGSLRYLKWLLNLGSQDEADNLLAGAEADLKASATANKTQASAMNTLSHLYHFTNRILDANLMALNAYKADPYLLDINKTILRLFQTSLDLNNAQQSKQWCDEGARRFPDDYRFAECRLWLLTLPDPATPPTAAQIWKANDDYLAMDKVDKPEFAKRKGMMLAGIALIRAGLKDSAESVIGRAQGNEAIDPAGDLVQLEAMARAQLGQKDRVISLLRRQIAAHPQQKNVGGHDESWWFKSVQDDPQYKALFSGGQ
ncbi:MAG TPA: serine/threonine-protein kinase [Gemmatimonadaceae bacterium]|jgi:serine/threonine-protein kinase|nr:serine/threonine-protein kinase [Gemmatimonadaceae bacterium]